MQENTQEITSRVVKGGITKSYGLGRGGHSREGSSRIMRNAPPTAWEISLSIVGADIVFARPRPPPAEVS